MSKMKRAVLIVLDSPGAGPVFVQSRVGKGGREFRFYKFRSMCPHAEEQLEALLPYNEMDGPAFKMKDDPRITRMGRILRRTSMDELPQLINILKGEMSIVGPRPERVEHVEKYSKEDMSIVGPRPSLPREVAQYDDRARQRLRVTPGLTCYWQIMPYRNRLSFEQWIDLDLRYIREQSFLTDWKIIFSTVRAVMGQYGQ